MSSKSSRPELEKADTVDEVLSHKKVTFNSWARALEGLNLKVDARKKKLVEAGPIVAAAAIRQVGPSQWAKDVRYPRRRRRRKSRF